MISYAEPLCGKIIEKMIVPESASAVEIHGVANELFFDGGTGSWLSVHGYVVSGQLKSGTGAGAVSTQITVPVVRCFELLPRVRVWASWLSPCFPEQDQDRLNWHRYNDGSICWTHPWTWVVNNKQDLDISVAQMLKDVRVVLNYHWIAFTERLPQWPETWPALPHGFMNACKKIVRE